MIASLTFAGAGCVRRVEMGRVETGGDGVSHATVLYTGVRDVSRRYADYGLIDAGILEGDD